MIIAHQMELKTWLSKFDQFLPRPVDSGGDGCVKREEPSLAECEAMWEVFKEDDVTVTSLRHIFGALVRWWNGNQIVGSTGFIPQGAHSYSPTMEMIDNIDWKGMLIIVHIKNVLGQGGILQVKHILSLLFQQVRI